jgi:hypothetical protein
VLVEFAMSWEYRGNTPLAAGLRVQHRHLPFCFHRSWATPPAVISADRYGHREPQLGPHM